MRDALEALEFHRVRQALAERASTLMGQEAALRFGPRASLEEALVQQATVAEALAYSYRLGGIRDLRPALAAAREGRRLEGIDLLAAAHSLEAATELKHELLEIGERLSALAASIGEHTLFRRRVRECLDDGGNVRDSASPRLREIRSALGPLRARIQERLYSIMDRQASAIQDRLITIRRDRYVIPVKASFQNQIPGIVLDQSDSGLTVFMEPAGVVPLNNQLASLRLEEEAEVNRILFELSGLLAGDPELPGTLEALVELDLARAAASLAQDWGLVRPRFEPGTYRLVQARHPLIQQAVANDLELSSEHRILLLTGPNMGGKTALLKTLGLAVLMAQSGLFVAAQSAVLDFPTQIFVDIGDEQSLQESLSTFAAHLLRLEEVLAHADARSLVLIDELGSGTDPEEGAALSQAFLERLLELGARGLITTHLTPLKAFAQEQPGIRNASMRFDLENLRPTYRLTVGSPGRSYALSIARRLGFPTEGVKRAEELLGPEGGRVERLLAALEAEREAARAERERAAAALREAEALRQELEARLGELEAQREKLLEEAREKAEQVVLEAQQQVRQAREKARAQGQGQALQDLLQLRSRYQKPPRDRPPAQPGLQVGAVVDVPEYGRGSIVEIRGAEAVVQMGAVRMSFPLASLQPREEARPKSTGGGRQRSSFDTELNLRGLTVEEALIAVDDYIEEARAVGATPLRLLHGKGTGALRNALREALKRDKRVQSFHDAVPYEGGHGVTVVHLK
jgi:DNA mismatch repair protein MutS2